MARRSHSAVRLRPLLGIWLLGMVFHASGAFSCWQTHAALPREVSVAGILACGMTLVIVTGGIDLAAGSLLGLCAMSFALRTLPAGLPGRAGAVKPMGLEPTIGYGPGSPPPGNANAPRR